MAAASIWFAATGAGAGQHLQAMADLHRYCQPSTFGQRGAHPVRGARVAGPCGHPHHEPVRAPEPRELVCSGGVGAGAIGGLTKQFDRTREPGVWMVRTATVIPDNERWLHEPQAAADLHSALTWAASNPATDSNTDDLIKRLSDGIE